MLVCACMYMLHGIGREVRRHFVGIGSILLPFGFWGIQLKLSGLVADRVIC